MWPKTFKLEVAPLRGIFDKYYLSKFGISTPDIGTFFFNFFKKKSLCNCSILVILLILDRTFVVHLLPRELDVGSHPDKSLEWKSHLFYERFKRIFKLRGSSKKATLSW